MDQFGRRASADKQCAAWSVRYEEEDRRVEASSPAPWAKLVRDDATGEVLAALPLADHCFDVAAVFEALLRGGAWNDRLTYTARRALREQDIARLTVLAALHDIGKANRGFQARIDRGAPLVGHEGEVSALLRDAGLRQTSAGQGLLGIITDWGAATYVAALMAHHGRPREEFGRLEAGKEPWSKHVRHWRADNGADPAAVAARLIAEVRARYPLAWEGGEKLPQDPRFIALFAGLLVLSDRTGSDTRRFPVEGPYGAAREAMRIDAADEAVVARGLAPIATPGGDFAAAFESYEPRGVQREAAADDLGAVALIEAETGSGKTEAALWRWLELRRRGAVDGLFFALPTRSAAVQLHGRVNRMLRRVWGEAAPEAVLAVPGYWRMGDSEGEALPGYRVRWDDDTGSGRPVDGRWAAEHSNQFLAARIAVGTIDQALLGALRIRHAPFRAAMLARSLIVVDEVHASDAYMGGLLERLLDNHVRAGGQALLLSATLGAAARARFLGGAAPSLTLAEAVAAPYPALSGSHAPLRGIAADAVAQKRVGIEVAGLIGDADAIAARAVVAARAGAAVLVVRNTVNGAVAVAQAVAALAPDLAFCVKGVATVHHGRFAPDDRRLLDAAVEAAFGKARTSGGRVLVGTQTLEQSLDIDADLLVTDLAPMDVLLQRIGRLHRHGGRERGDFAEARVVVLRPAARDLTPLLGAVGERHGLGPTRHGSGPYPELLPLEATLRLLEANPTVSIPADNRRLVEHALHPEILEGIADELGNAWRNHANARAGNIHADRNTAEALSLDLSTAFRDLVFPVDEDAVATRLGARDLLVDMTPAFPGPFGAPVERIKIPAWMAGPVGPDDRPTPAVRDGDGWRFELGKRSFRYGRWGLVSGEA
jgi:CRISPR-associated endonuclease/helicase Cas3